MPDGAVLDGLNDWDGDGMTNAKEFEFGFNPIDPTSYGTLPASTPLGLLVLVLLLLACEELVRGVCARTHHIRSHHGAGGRP